MGLNELGFYLGRILLSTLLGEYEYFLLFNSTSTPYLRIYKTIFNMVTY